MRNYEHCIECEERTGRAGASDDSLYHGYSGPFCEDCFDAWPDNQVSQIILLRQELKQAQARVASLEHTGRLCCAVKSQDSQAWLLRKQAEAVDEFLSWAVDYCSGWAQDDMGRTYWHDKQIEAYAKRLRNEAERVEDKNA